jgi:hypothetical protein
MKGVCCPGFLEKPGRMDEVEEAWMEKRSQS